AQSRRDEVVSRENRQDTWSLTRRGNVDAHDSGMRVDGAHDDGVRLARQVDVVVEATPTPGEADVLEALDRLPDTQGVHHERPMARSRRARTVDGLFIAAFRSAPACGCP